MIYPKLQDRHLRCVACIGSLSFYLFSLSTPLSLSLPRTRLRVRECVRECLQPDHPIFLNPYQKHRAYLQLQKKETLCTQKVLHARRQPQLNSLTKPTQPKLAQPKTTEGVPEGQRRCQDRRHRGGAHGHHGPRLRRGRPGQERCLRQDPYGQDVPARLPTAVARGRGGRARARELAVAVPCRMPQSQILHRSQ